MSEILKNRIEFMCLVEAKGCNPNGDPDMGNLARQDEDTELGYITDVALKRRIRNYIDDAYGTEDGMQILIRDGICTNEKIAESVLTVNGMERFPKDFVNTKIPESRVYMNQKYWDVRTFGGVLSTGWNGGQVNGPVQIDGANFSIDPIQPESISITRMCYTGDKYNTLEEYRVADSELSNDKKRTMGTKEFIPYGLYLVRGTVSACLAQKTGFTEEDLNRLFEAIVQMYNHGVSSSKTGMTIVGPLIIFKHVGTQAPENEKQNAKEAMLGCAPTHKLYNLLDIHKKDEVLFPRKYEDYEIVLNASKLPAGVKLGFKSYPFEPVTWYDPERRSQYDDLEIELR